jgi:hypothetical protein
MMEALPAISELQSSFPLELPQTLPGTEAATALIAGKISAATRKHYVSCLGKMAKWFALNGRKDLVVVEDGGNERLRIPLDPAAVLSFFGFLADNDGGKAQELADAEAKEAGEEVKQRVRRTKKADSIFSPTALNAYRSALTWFCGLHHVEMERDLFDRLGDLISGYRKKVAKMRKNGQLPSIEGRHPVSLPGYRLIAMKFLTLTPELMKNSNKRTNQSWNEGLFAWPYWLLLWNLMQRSETVAHIQLDHISWKEDSLTIVIPQSKSDQEGDRVCHRHIYANPLDPSICPVLSLALLIFSKSFHHAEMEKKEEEHIQMESWPLFLGTKQEHRMSYIMARVLKKIGISQADLALLNNDPSFLGLHSPRKGANTYCSSFVGGPSFPSICHRGGWAIGGVQDRYNFFQDGADQFVGRVVSGLPFHSSAFATLPPHFSSETLKSISDADWKQILPLYDQYPTGFRLCLPFFLASIVYHEPFLRKTLSPHHSLFFTPLFAQADGLLSRLRPQVLLGELECPVTKMEARGIPPTLAIASKLGKIFTEIHDTKEDINVKLPIALTETLLEKFTINGAVPITREDFKNYLGDFSKLLEERIARSETVIRTVVSTESTGPDGPNGHHMFLWKGRMHPIPEGWKMPTVSCKDMWALWNFGIPAERIAPFKTFHKYDFSNPNEAGQLFKAQKVMKALTSLAMKLKLFPENSAMKDLTMIQMNEIFDKAFTEMMSRIEGRKIDMTSRCGESAYGTINNKILKWEKNCRQRESTQMHEKDISEGLNTLAELSVHVRNNINSVIPMELNN